MPRPGCSKDRKSDCLTRTDCDWIVGKGCRSNQEKPRENKKTHDKQHTNEKKIIIPLKDQDNGKFTFTSFDEKQNVNVIRRDIPMDINKIHRMYLEIFALQLGLSKKDIRCKRVPELREYIKPKLIFNKK